MPHLRVKQRTSCKKTFPARAKLVGRDRPFEISAGLWVSPAAAPCSSAHQLMVNSAAKARENNQITSLARSDALVPWPSSFSMLTLDLLNSQRSEKALCLISSLAASLIAPHPACLTTTTSWQQQPASLDPAHLFDALSLGDRGSLVWSAYGAAQPISTLHVHALGITGLPAGPRNGVKTTAQQVSASTASTVGSLGAHFRYSAAFL